MVEQLSVSMRDGVELETRVWKPSTGDEHPVVLERGYEPGIESHAEAFVDANYVYVGQNARGDLTGNMFFPDRQDGYDCLDWISEQPWCDGNIGMYGRSFRGATQWLVATEGHPNLKAIIPQNITSELWEQCYRDHGALQLAHTARRIYMRDGAVPQEELLERIAEYGGWEEYYRHTPILTMDTILGTENKLWRQYVTHSIYDDFWQDISIRDELERIDIPTYIMGGWYDGFPGPQFRDFTEMQDNSDSDDVHIVINPSNHGNELVGDRDWGQNAEKDELGLAIRWFDCHLKSEKNGVSEDSPIQIYVMGENEWREENEWPLARTSFANYYLGEGGDLLEEPPKGDSSTSYVYDPENPVPTLGGNHSSPEDNPEIIRVGAVDQQPNEERDDVLVFTTPPLETEVEVTGPIEATIYAATSAKDTDFMARLIDVYPDGTAYNLTEGLIRARFRESIWELPKLLEPHETYEYTIDMNVTANVFKPGHRICLHVTSSNFPLYDRNPNTGYRQALHEEQTTASQTIYHSAEYPSHITLPIIPR